MCILQRIALFVTGCVFLAAALHNPRHWGAKVYGVLLALTIGMGAAISMRHIWLQYFIPDDSALACGMSYDYMMEVFSPFEALTMILRGTGDCTEVVWTFLGLSIPSWTLICFLILGIIGIARNWMRTEPVLNSAMAARS
jgi:disulfide bond formation protein DsbB